MLIELVAVLHRRMIDLRRDLARVHQRLGIAAELLAGGGDLGGRLARGGAFAAGDEEPELAVEAAQALLQRAAHRGGQPARMPVEAEHAAEGLEPERIGEPPQHLFAAELAGDERDDLARQRHHAREEPRRRVAAVQRQMGESGAAQRAIAGTGAATAAPRARAPGSAWITIGRGWGASVGCENCAGTVARARM